MTMKCPSLEENCDVAIIGGGTAGLSAAAELKRLGIDHVVVLEREDEAGGVPRHCDHFPFGLSEYKRLMKGPAYARKNQALALQLGVDIRCGTSVTALCPSDMLNGGALNGAVLEVATRNRRYRLKAKRVIICTGVRESSRAQRFLGGDRPNGVITTGALQALVYLKAIKPFERPLILGSELVSFSAIMTCRHLGIQPAAMVEENDRILARQICQPFLLLNRIPLHTGVRNPRIIGKHHVEALEFTDAGGNTRQVETDGIIISGRFRPESALLRDSHLKVDGRTGGPVVDQYYRCSDPAYFCAGNLIRPAETSAFCWREGVATARRVVADLAFGGARTDKTISLISKDPNIGFIIPQKIRLTDDFQDAREKWGRFSQENARNNKGQEHLRDPNFMEKALAGEKTIYLGLSREVNGTISIDCPEGTLWRGRLKSQPVRRVLIPLPEIDRHNPPSELRIKTST